MTADEISVLGTLMSATSPLLVLEIAARTRLAEGAVLTALIGLGGLVSCAGSQWSVPDREAACVAINAARRAWAFSNAFAGLARQGALSPLRGQAGA